MPPLVLISCCKTKRSTPTPARDLYVSPLFVKSRRWAERHGDWLILSALHGVVTPDEVIAPYDLTLARMAAGDRVSWAARVAEALRPHAGRDIIALAGSLYLGWVGPAFPRVSIPLKGLGLGQRMAWLDRENAAAP